MQERSSDHAIDSRKAAIELIFDVIDELNEQFPERQLEKSTNTQLLGEGSALDSLGLVSLIVNVEEKIEQRFGCSVTLVDERAMSLSHSPFRTVETFADYIVALTNDHGT